MDHRSVNPKDLKENMLSSIHFGLVGRHAMLGEASDIWRSRIYREIDEKAREGVECRQEGKNLKSIRSQNEFGKLPEAKQLNEEISIDLAGPFQNVNQKKMCLILSVDNHSEWPARCSGQILHLETY